VNNLLLAKPDMAIKITIKTVNRVFIFISFKDFKNTDVVYIKDIIFPIRFIKESLKPLVD